MESCDWSCLRHEGAGLRATSETWSAGPPVPFFLLPGVCESPEDSGHTITGSWSTLESSIDVANSVDAVIHAPHAVVEVSHVPSDGPIGTADARDLAIP
jgi:hypothetical protein